MAEPLIGCTYVPSEANLVHLEHPRGATDGSEGFATADKCDEWQDHWLHPVRLTTGKVIARLNDTPYLVENRIGKGRVFFVTALNMVGSDENRRGPEPFLYSNTLAHFLHNLGDHLGDGVTFAPWTSLEHICNRKPDGTAMLLVMNHGDMAYRRDVTLKNHDGFTKGRVVAQGTWEGWYAGKALALERDGQRLKWSFDLPPKSFILFELSR